MPKRPPCAGPARRQPWFCLGLLLVLGQSPAAQGADDWSSATAVTNVTFQDTLVDAGRIEGFVRWTPPSDPLIGDTTITRYFVAIAADSVGTASADLWDRDLGTGYVPYGTNQMNIWQNTGRLYTPGNPADWLIVHAWHPQKGRQPLDWAAKTPLYDYTLDLPSVDTLDVLSFTDEDPLVDQVGGTAQWTIANGADLAYTTEYAVYLAADASGTDEVELGTVQVATNQLVIPSGTAIDVRKHLLVYPKNPNGRSASAKSLQITDLQPTTSTAALTTLTMTTTTVTLSMTTTTEQGFPPGNLTFEDTNMLEGHIGGSIARWVPPVDASSVDSYSLYIAYDAAGSYLAQLWYMDPAAQDPEPLGPSLPVGTNEFVVYEPTLRRTTNSEYPANWLLLLTTKSGVLQPVSTAQKIPLYDASSNLPGIAPVSVDSSSATNTPSGLEGAIRWSWTDKADLGTTTHWKIFLAADASGTSAASIGEVSVDVLETAIPGGWDCQSGAFVGIYSVNPNGMASTVQWVENFACTTTTSTSTTTTGTTTVTTSLTTSTASTSTLTTLTFTITTTTTGPTEAVPTAVTGLTFVDTNPAAGQIGGSTITWTPPSDTSLLTHYTAWIAYNAAGDYRAQLWWETAEDLGRPVPVGTNSFTIYNPTERKTGYANYPANWLIVMTAKDGVFEPIETAAKMPLYDLSSDVPGTLSATIDFTDTDPGPDSVGGTIQWTPAAQSDLGFTTTYEVYLAQDPAGTAEQLIGTTPVETTQLDIPGGTACTGFNRYILIYAVNPNGRASTPVSTLLPGCEHVLPPTTTTTTTTITTTGTTITFTITTTQTITMTSTSTSSTSTSSTFTATTTTGTTTATTTTLAPATVQGANFIDTNPVAGVLDGIIRWNAPADTTSISRYIVYMAYDAEGSFRTLLQYQDPQSGTLSDSASVGTNQFYLPTNTQRKTSDTSFPANWLLVFSEVGGQEQPVEDAARMPLVDNSGQAPGYLNLTINFTDLDDAAWRIGGTVSWSAAAGSDLGPIMGYAIYVALDLCGGGSQLLQTAPRGATSVYVPLGTIIGEAEVLLIYPQNSYGTAGQPAYVLFEDVGRSPPAEPTTPTVCSTTTTSVTTTTTLPSKVVVEGLAYSDTDARAGYLGGSLTWSLPAFTSVIEHYEAYLAYDALGSHKERLSDAIYGQEVPPDATSWTLPADTVRQTVNADPLLPANWLLLYIHYTSSLGGSLQPVSDAAKILLYDQSPGLPSVPDLTFDFTDLTVSGSSVGGTAAWTPASSEDLAVVTHYAVYLASNGLGTGEVFLQDVLVGTDSVTIPPGTDCSNWTHILVYAVNPNGRSPTATSSLVPGCYSTTTTTTATETSTSSTTTTLSTTSTTISTTATGTTTSSATTTATRTTTFTTGPSTTATTTSTGSTKTTVTTSTATTATTSTTATYTATSPPGSMTTTTATTASATTRTATETVTTLPADGPTTTRTRTTLTGSTLSTSTTTLTTTSETSTTGTGPTMPITSTSTTFTSTFSRTTRTATTGTGSTTSATTVTATTTVSTSTRTTRTTTTRTATTGTGSTTSATTVTATTTVSTSTRTTRTTATRTATTGTGSTTSATTVTATTTVSTSTTTTRTATTGTGSTTSATVSTSTRTTRTTTTRTATTGTGSTTSATTVTATTTLSTSTRTTRTTTTRTATTGTGSTTSATTATATTTLSTSTHTTRTTTTRTATTGTGSTTSATTATATTTLSTSTRTTRTTTTRTATTGTGSTTSATTVTATTTLSTSTRTTRTTATRTATTGTGSTTSATTVTATTTLSTSTRLTRTTTTRTVTTGTGSTTSATTVTTTTTLYTSTSTTRSTTTRTVTTGTGSTTSATTVTATTTMSTSTRTTRTTATGTATTGTGSTTSATTVTATTTMSTSTRTTRTTTTRTATTGTGSTTSATTLTITGTTVTTTTTTATTATTTKTSGTGSTTSATTLTATTAAPTGAITTTTATTQTATTGTGTASVAVTVSTSSRTPTITATIVTTSATTGTGSTTSVTTVTATTTGSTTTASSSTATAGTGLTTPLTTLTMTSGTGVTTSHTIATTRTTTTGTGDTLLTTLAGTTTISTSTLSTTVAVATSSTTGPTTSVATPTDTTTVTTGTGSTTTATTRASSGTGLTTSLHTLADTTTVSTSTRSTTTAMTRTATTDTGSTTSPATLADTTTVSASTGPTATATTRTATTGTGSTTSFTTFTATTTVSTSTRSTITATTRTATRGTRSTTSPTTLADTTTVSAGTGSTTIATTRTATTGTGSTTSLTTLTHTTTVATSTHSTATATTRTATTGTGSTTSLTSLTATTTISTSTGSTITATTRTATTGTGSTTSFTTLTDTTTVSTSSGSTTTATTRTATTGTGSTTSVTTLTDTTTVSTSALSTSTATTRSATTGTGSTTSAAAVTTTASTGRGAITTVLSTTLTSRAFVCELGASGCDLHMAAGQSCSPACQVDQESRNELTCLVDSAGHGRLVGSPLCADSTIASRLVEETHLWGLFEAWVDTQGRSLQDIDFGRALASALAISENVATADGAVVGRELPATQEAFLAAGGSLPGPGAQRGQRRMQALPETWKQFEVEYLIPVDASALPGLQAAARALLDPSSGQRGRFDEALRLSPGVNVITLAELHKPHVLKFWRLGDMGTPLPPTEGGGGGTVIAATVGLSGAILCCVAGLVAAMVLRRRRKEEEEIFVKDLNNDLKVMMPRTLLVMPEPPAEDMPQRFGLPGFLSRETGNDSENSSRRAAQDLSPGSFAGNSNAPLTPQRPLPRRRLGEPTGPRLAEGGSFDTTEESGPRRPKRTLLALSRPPGAPPGVPQPQRTRIAFPRRFTDTDFLVDPLDERPESHSSPMPSAMLFSGERESPGKLRRTHSTHSGTDEPPVYRSSPQPARMLHTRIPHPAGEQDSEPETESPITRRALVMEETYSERTTPRSSPSPPPMLFRVFGSITGRSASGELPPRPTSPNPRGPQISLPKRPRVLSAVAQAPPSLSAALGSSTLRGGRWGSSSPVHQPDRPVGDASDALEDCLVDMEVDQPHRSRPPDPPPRSPKSGWTLSGAPVLAAQALLAPSGLLGVGSRTFENSREAARIGEEATPGSWSPQHLSVGPCAAAPLAPRKKPRPTPLQLQRGTSSVDSSEFSLQDIHISERPSEAQSLPTSPMHYSEDALAQL